MRSSGGPPARRGAVPPRAPRNPARRPGSVRLPGSLGRRAAASGARPGMIAGSGDRGPDGGAPGSPRAAAPPPGPRRRITLTRRAAILASAVCAVVALLAYPLREYAAQRSEINGLRTQNVATSQQVSELVEQHRRWQDPAYVRIQARERLHYVMPGETPYVVVRGTPSPSPTADPTQGVRGATPGG